jgi:hypothetical protein
MFTYIDPAPAVMEEQSKQSSTKGQNCRSHKGQVGRSQEADPLAAVGCWEQERAGRPGRPLAER